MVVGVGLGGWFVYFSVIFIILVFGTVSWWFIGFCRFFTMDGRSEVRVFFAFFEEFT